jgi:HK97 family phage major capsid protein
MTAPKGKVTDADVRLRDVQFNSESLDIESAQRRAAGDALVNAAIRSGIREPWAESYRGGSGFRGNWTTETSIAVASNARTLREFDERRAEIEQAGRNATNGELAYRQYLRTGDAESRDLAAGATTGSYLVPPGLLGPLLFGVQYFSAVVGRARLWHSVSANGTPFGGPATVPLVTGDVADSVGTVAEGTQSTQTNLGGSGGITDVAFSNAPLYIAKNLLRVGFALMQDAQVDFAELVDEAFAMRIARQLDSDFIGTIAAGASQVTTTAGATSITLDDLASLVYDNLDTAHIGAPNTALVVSRATAKYLRENVKDSANRPIVSDMALNTSTESSEQFGGHMTRTVRTMSLWGIPVVTSRAMSDIGSTNVSAILANFDSAFIFRFVEASVLRLSELWADYAQVGFSGWFRADGKIADQSALAVLRQHA